MPQGKRIDPPVEWKVCIPREIAEKIELAFLDPITMKPSYGARAQLITALLQRWLGERNVPQAAAQQTQTEEECKRGNITRT